MTHIQIDPRKCLKDGICLEECPEQIIRFNTVTGHPEITPERGNECIVCGHCVAVCPHGALRHTQIPFEKCPPTPPPFTKDQITGFLRHRRSARVFMKTPVKKGTIQAVIDIARYAPTANNAQLIKWIVFTEKEQINALTTKTIGWMRELIEKGPEAVYAPYIIPLVSQWDNGQDDILRDTPALVFAMAPDQAFYGMVDVTIALSYFELAAPGVGLSCCWAGMLHRAMLQHAPLREHAGIPANFPHFYPMMLGYSKHSYHRLPERKKPKILWR